MCLTSCANVGGFGAALVVVSGFLEPEAPQPVATAIVSKAIVHRTWRSIAPLSTRAKWLTMSPLADQRKVAMGETDTNTAIDPDPHVKQPRPWTRILAIAGITILLLGLAGIGGFAIYRQSQTISRVRGERADLERRNAVLDKDAAAAKNAAKTAQLALVAVTAQLATTKKQLATAKKQAAAQYVTGYSSGYQTGQGGTADAYNNGYNDGYSAGYNAGLCVDPGDGSYVC